MERSRPLLGEEEPPPGRPTPAQTELQRLLAAGRALFGSEEEAQALSVFKAAFLLSGSASESCLCLFNLGAAYVATGKPRKALRCLRKAQRTGLVPEGDGDFCFNVAAAYERMGKYRKAEDFYRKAIDGCGEGDPKSMAEAQVKRGYCLASMGEAALAASCFCSAGQAYQKARLVDEAGMACREAAKFGLRSATFPPKETLRLVEEGRRACARMSDQKLQGQAYQKARLVDEAGMACREAAKFGLRSATLPPKETLRLVEEGRRACARMSDQKLQGKLYNDLGLHYVELGRFAEAEGCFQEALHLCNGGGGGGGSSVQNRAVLLQNLGAVCNARGHFTRSLGFHSQAASLHGSLGKRHHGAHAQSLYNLAWAHGQAGNLHMAEFYCLQAQKSFAEAGDRSGEGRAWEWLASLRLRLGHPELAAQSYREALRLFAESKEMSEAPSKHI